MAVTDDQLVQGLRDRDSTALAALVDVYASPVYSLVHRILAGSGSDQDVEECTSDVFHTAWLRISHYDPARAPLRTWLLILAKYQALDRRRSLLRHVGHPMDVEWKPVATPEDVLSTAEERREVQGALDQLAPLDRELVYRRYFLDERVDEIAQSLELTRQAADNRLWRARKALRQILAGAEGGASGER